MHRVILLSPAQRDYRKAIEWYAKKSLQAATAFETSVDVGLKRIGEAPEVWPTCDEQHRFYILRRFPFSIVYRIVANEEILVVAIAHSSRNTGYWRRRKS